MQLLHCSLSVSYTHLSRFAVRGIKEGKQVKAVIDFLPDRLEKQLFADIEERVYYNGYKTVESLFIGLLNKKLIPVIRKEARIPAEKNGNQLSKKEIGRLAKIIKNFEAEISGYNSFEQAQVCSGGISTKEIDRDTMESKLCRNLFFAGEIIDIDGTCGGYNLQWAWSSGMTAGYYMSERKLEEEQ